MNFSKFETQIYLFLAESMGSEETLSAYEFEGGFRAGYFQVGDERDPIDLVFSFPKNGRDCYLMATDGDPYELCKEMSALQEYNESTAHLCSTHTVKTNSQYMDRAGWVAYLITTPAVLTSDLPNSADITGEIVRFHLAIPLCKEEYEIKLANDNDTLMEYFEKTRRDIVAFGAHA